MKIDLNEILTEAGKEKSYTVEIEAGVLTLGGQEFQVSDSGQAQISFTNQGNKVVSMIANIEVTVISPCDRCLEPTGVPVDISVDKDIDLKKTTEEREAELDECAFLQGMNFDTEVFIRNEILVNLPMKVLCSNDCKGICNKCGTNLNNGSCDCDTTELDPRMSKILDVFNQFKEV